MSNDNMMRALAKASKEAGQVEAEIETLEMLVSQKKMYLKNLLTETIPSYMDALGCASFEMVDFEVSVKSSVKGTLPKGAGHQRAIDWLNANGGAEIVKNVITVPFAKGQDNEAKDLQATLVEKGFATERTSTVHPQTLAAWGRTKLESGDPFEPEILGLYVERKAVIKDKNK